ncbi:MAG: alkaline phosphatase family protein [Verrucomicrobia bacterium]|nr:alkaline phosphatase family protein [Verrucomicrobiota bacterium]MDA1065333.1 alkaline phosphatase family protein [Verrucomicrobiota bacterium]
MKRTAVINVVGLTAGLLGDHTPCINALAKRGNLTSFKPSFPAVTCTAQSDFLTGKNASEHGVVANGWYNRDYSEVHFWKQSNHLVKGPKLWDELRDEAPGFTCAKMFWWYNMYSTVDFSVTPRPMYPADGRKFFDVYTHPMGMKEEMKRDLGEFPFHTFWGPKAGIESSQWIAASAKWIEEKEQPTLNLVYLPHLDYNLQRLGSKDPAISKDLSAIDTLVGELFTFFESKSIQVVLLSEYGITSVDNPIHINRALRKKGWLTIKPELGLEQLDYGASEAFAVADHQVAHVYVKNKELLNDVKQTLESLEGIDRVLDEEGKAEFGIHHERSGDLIAIADSKSWFTYYYWLDDDVAPDFARCVDIHRKPGYDPVELFLDPTIRLPFLKIAWFLLKKKLGFRALLDVIPLDANLVKGSHGRIPEDENDWPLIISEASNAEVHCSTDVYNQLRTIILGN